MKKYLLQNNYSDDIEYYNTKSLRDIIENKNKEYFINEIIKDNK